MRLVILESPYAAPTPEGIAENIAYARACVRDCLGRFESAIASHLLYTQDGILRDEIAAERALGIKAGHAWIAAAAAVVVYMDRGISSGMAKGIERANALGVPVEIRSLREGC
jgi:hypothetical protein